MSNNKGVRLEKENYAIEVKYDDEAIKKKNIKIITKSGEEIVFTADEMASIIMSQVNAEVLSASFVETERINLVEVSRQLECELKEDMKKGTRIRMDYVHPYPLEFALLEQVYNIAKINKDVPAIEITDEYLKKTMEKIGPDQEKFIKKFYESFKNLKNGK